MEEHWATLDYVVRLDISVKPEAEDPIDGYDTMDQDITIRVPVKLLPLLQPPVRARAEARTNPSAHRSTQLRSVLARVYAVSIQNQITTTVP
jgi:hypothetical protein